MQWMYHHKETAKSINKLWWNKDKDSQEVKTAPSWAELGSAKDKHRALISMH